MFSLLRSCAIALLMLPWLTSPAVVVAATLTLAEAERLALLHDVSAPEMQAQGRALREQAVADAQLPDPSLSLGVMSLPVDSFSRTAEPMTQTTVGVTQAIPAGDSLKYQAERSTNLAVANDAEAEARRRAVLRDVRSAYLELQYQAGALAVIADSQQKFSELVDITKSLYRVGRSNLQDVLSAQLERSLLNDRERQQQVEYAATRADLVRLTGALPPDLTPPLDLPELREPPMVDALREALTAHPMLDASNARVAAGQSAVQAAREQYKPGWMVNLTYGERGGREPNGDPRSDMLSAMVTFDLPIFTGKRQDKRVAASVEETDALRYARDATHFDLLRMLDAEYPRWEQFRAREQGYADDILPAANNNAEAALSAYSNGVTDFNVLLRANLTVLDSRLQALRTRVDRLQTQTRLLYLAGEKQ